MGESEATHPQTNIGTEATWTLEDLTEEFGHRDRGIRLCDGMNHITRLKELSRTIAVAKPRGCHRDGLSVDLETSINEIHNPILIDDC